MRLILTDNALSQFNNALSMSYTCTAILDTDECVLATLHSCSDICTNTDGSYTCSCNTGYRLDSNGYTCNGQYMDHDVTVSTCTVT